MTEKVYPIKIENDRNTLFVYWTLTDFCNFKCNYCPEFLHSGDYAKGKKIGFPTDEEIFKFLNDLKNRHLKSRKLLLVLSGGEPTLHPLFPTIVEFLLPLGTVSVTTNGSRSIEWWKDLKGIPDEYIISLHPEFSKIEKINELANYLVNQGKKVFFNLSCDANNWIKVKELYDHLDENLKNKVFPKILTDIEGDKQLMFNLNQSQLEWINYLNKKWKNSNVPESTFNRAKIIFNNGHSSDANISEILLKKYNQFRNWKCSAGIDGIKINFDGSVYAGICKQQLLGRIDNFNLLDDYLTCKYEYCVCNGDIRLDKYKN